MTNDYSYIIIEIFCSILDTTPGRIDVSTCINYRTVNVAHTKS